MTDHGWQLRPLALDDGDELGRVHKAIWRDAYAGIMPDDHLAALCVELLGDRDATLWVVEQNARARAFYARHGFVDEGGRDTHPGTGTPELRMVRRTVVPAGS